MDPVFRQRYVSKEEIFLSTVSKISDAKAPWILFKQAFFFRSLRATGAVTSQPSAPLAGPPANAVAMDEGDIICHEQLIFLLRWTFSRTKLNWLS